MVFLGMDKYGLLEARVLDCLTMLTKAVGQEHLWQENNRHNFT